MMLSPLQRRRTDQMVLTMSRFVADGDLLGEGIGTFLSSAAYMLARHTHAPRGVSLCPNGNTLMLGPRRLSLGQDEQTTVPQALVFWDYIDVNLGIMPGAFIEGRPQWTEFMRPAQIDAWGWTNNVRIGSEGTRSIRLPGAAGIPDATSVSRRVFYYVPRHAPEVFVRTLDHVSGVGNARPGEAASAWGPKRIVVVSDLCVMESGAEGRLQVISLNEGVTRADVQLATGFAPAWHEALADAPHPAPHEQALLDETIDPQGLRFLECVNGRARRARLRELVGSSIPPAGGPA